MVLDKVLFRGRQPFVNCCRLRNFAIRLATWVLCIGEVRVSASPRPRSCCPPRRTVLERGRAGPAAHPVHDGRSAICNTGRISALLATRALSPAAAELWASAPAIVGWRGTVGNMRTVEGSVEMGKEGPPYVEERSFREEPAYVEDPA
jgi:hypothetical protein